MLSGLLTCGRCGARMPQAELNLDVLRRAIEAGLGDADVSAVAELLRADEVAALSVGTEV